MEEFKVLNYFENLPAEEMEQAYEKAYELLDYSLRFMSKKKKEERKAELKIKIDEIRKNGWYYYVELYLGDICNRISSLEDDMKGKADDLDYYD